MGELGGLVQEEVLHNAELERREGRLYVVRVWIRLRYVLALHVEGLEGPLDCAVEHVRDPEPWL